MLAYELLAGSEWQGIFATAKNDITFKCMLGLESVEVVQEAYAE